MILTRENGRYDLASKVFLILFIPAGLSLVIMAIMSLSWRVQFDHGIMFYISYLIDHFHRVPYKEVYDMNFPGSYLINILIGRVFGYTDLGIRIADIFIFALFSFFTFNFVKRISYKSAIVSVIVFGIIYFQKRPYLTLQREYFIVAIFSVILFLFTLRSERKSKIFFIGILLGICFTIKPHSIIFIPALVVYKFIELKYIDRKNSFVKSIFKYCILLIVGSLIPITAVCLWLYICGGLESFVDMVINYLPLYASMNKAHTVITGIDKYIYIFNEFFQFTGRPLLFGAAVIGAYFSLFRSNLQTRLKKNILLICILAVTFSLYTLFSGQFWEHHWLPYIYFISILISLCFSENLQLKKFEKYFVTFLAAAAMLSILVPSHGYITQLKGQDVANAKRVSEITEYLNKNSRPDDLIQPLDWVGGTAEALFEAHRNIATRFVYDFHFYHDVSNPYIQDLQREFIDELIIKPPQFIIKTLDERPYLQVPEQLKIFPNLITILSKIILKT